MLGTLLAALAAVSLSGPAVGQNPPLVKLREIASFGPGDGGRASETHLAVSDTHVFVVHRQDSSSGTPGYAVKEKSSSTWTTGDVAVIGGDPSVAYNAVDNRFLIAQLSFSAIRITEYDPTGVGSFNFLGPSITEPLGGLDKPWIVRGRNDLTAKEFYVTAHKGAGVGRYARTTDGGFNWTEGDLADKASNFSVEPSVANTARDTPLYVVWTTGAGFGSYEFLRGDDSGSGTTFTSLLDSGGSPVTVDPIRLCADCSSVAPGPFPVKASPHLAADPTNRDRLYLVYYDSAGSSLQELKDLDVFCVRLDFDGTAWSAGTPVRVNDDVNDPQDPEAISTRSCPTSPWTTRVACTSSSTTTGTTSKLMTAQTPSTTSTGPTARTMARPSPT